MRRREFIGLVGGAAVLSPRTTRAAEPGKVYRIALVSPAVPVSEMAETTSYPGWSAALLEFRKLGYLEGNNLVLLRFSANGDPARLDSLVRDVVDAAPDVIVAQGSRMVLAVKAATRTIPVVGSLADPVAFGIVGSLAHPEGNITGVASDAGAEIWGKRLEILLEAVPTAKRVAFLISETLWDRAMGTTFREAAEHFSVSIVGSRIKVASQAEYRRVFESFEREQAQALVVADQAEHGVQRDLIVELAEKARLPALYPLPGYVPIGGLMAYTYDIDDNYRRMADYADLILKGARPGDLPIYQVTKFKTIINLKTAKALGMNLSMTLLARADEVIE